MTPSLVHAFRRPAVIAAILVLLFNDHILKRAVPSVWTGKISDFAGLFFFPLLLGALIQLAAVRFGRKAPRALLLALAFTGLLFAAIKTLPAANSAFENALRLLLGPTVQIVRDPTDLLALVMLYPAWLVGRRAAALPPRRPGRIPYAALALGALASIATSPCLPGPSVIGVASVDGQLYAAQSLYEQGPYGPETITVYRYAGEAGWVLEESPAAQITAELSAPAPQLPVTLCDPSAPTVCYSIDGTAEVLESTDGGQAWRSAWSIPPERQSFMRRMTQPGFCAKVPELRLRDIALLPGGPVVAAAGNEGLVVRGKDGDWQRVGIDRFAAPTPFRARNLGDALTGIQAELITAGAASLLAYALISIFSRRMPPGERWTARPKWALHPLLFVLPLLLAAVSVWIAFLEANSPGRMLTHLIVFFEAVALALMFFTMLAALLSEPPGARRSAGVWAILTVFSLLVIPLLVFLLWAFGVIARYDVALALAVVLGLLALSLLARRLVKALRQPE